MNQKQQRTLERLAPLLPSLAAAVAGVEYNDERHEYTVAGVRHRSVTQTLTDAGQIDTRYYTDEACARGSRLHRAIELWDGCKAPEQMGLRSQDTGSWRCYCRWLAESQTVTVANEQRVRFGHVDRVGIDRAGNPGVYDFKTGAHSMWHYAQIAKYWYEVGAAIGHDGLTAWLVYLPANGVPKAERLSETQIQAGLAMFAAAAVICESKDKLGAAKRSRGLI